VHDDAGQLRPSTERQGEFHEGPSALQAVKEGGGPVRGDRLGAGGQAGGDEGSGPRQRVATDQVHARVDAPEAAGAEAIVDGVTGKAEVEELLAGHHAVLGGGEGVE
jgi:hypothetical protein